ncbi:putative maleylacetate reductase [Phaeomoniella chlamydospora]|uniref:Putative maleylacetate reductase n=1 Tax=Phaeomoniella chlamydospora TaxID=158046 RepID=A0A0G2GHE8_PHACM|nr:putative maleylacetate reductase [Phaeomoniella chlamydospora]
MDSTGTSPPILSGFYKPQNLKGLFYGPEVVKSHLLSCLPTTTSRAFIITGESLYTKTPLISFVEEILSPERHAGTFSKIKQHVPIAEVNEAVSVIVQSQNSDESPAIDTVISVGGGSPICAAKVISHIHWVQTGKFLSHITIPTTLSAAECTTSAGYKDTDGTKKAVNHPSLTPEHVLYDPYFGSYTPPTLFLSTGIRALDHAVEAQYHPLTPHFPSKILALESISLLFTHLPIYHEHHHRQPQPQPPHQIPSNSLTQTITTLFLASHLSLSYLGIPPPTYGPLGLSHVLGYAIGSPYNIPHGITSCMTLSPTIRLKTRIGDPETLKNIARIAKYIPETHDTNNQATATAATTIPSTDLALAQAEKVSSAIESLIESLGLQRSLSKDYNLGKDQVDVIVERVVGKKGNGGGIGYMGKLIDVESGGKEEVWGRLERGVRMVVEGLF